jgi:hypothetical protein
MGTESIVAADIAYDYPVGLMNFTIDCGTPGFASEITQYFYNLNNSSFIARKFNPNTSAYFTIAGALVSQVEIGGLKAVKSVYTATDGGLLDSDGTANGIIVDPAGLGQSLFGAPRTGAGGTSK